MRMRSRGIVKLLLATWTLACLCRPAFAAEAGLSGFNVAAENEHLVLYLNESSVEFAVLEKGSGEVWYSNPFDRERKETLARGSAKAMLNAQILITYFEANRQLQMDSYNDSVAHGQYEIVPIDGGFRVDYQIGRVWKDSDFMPLVISEERFNERILANVERERDRRFLRDQYVLVELEPGYVDPDGFSIAGVDLERLLGEYGFKVHDSLRPQDKRRLLQEYLVKVRDAQGYSGIGQVTSEDIQGLAGKPTLMLRWDVKEWDKEAIWELAREAGYTPEDVIEDHRSYGIAPPLPNPRTFRLSVEYVLDGESLVVRVPAGSITYPNQVIDPATGNTVTYPLTSISLLPYFGAADVDSEGYLLVPDGSGALIYTNSGKSGVQPYNGVVYGRDLATQPVPEFSTVDMEQIYLPVFGLKEEGRAFVAIIEEGDAIARIEATVSGMRDSFNKVWASFDVMPQVRVNLESEGALIGLRQLTLNMYQVRPYLGEIAVRYSFLTGEEATYVGMAKRYREYLIEREGLARLPASDRLPLLLHAVGSIDRIQPVFGVPSSVVLPLTTHRQAEEIVQELIAAGIDEVHLRYLGWLEGGVRHVFPDGVRLERSLGSDASLRALEASLDGAGSSLFLDVGFAFVRKNRLFDGFVDYLHSARFLNRNQAYVTSHDIATYQPIDSQRMLLLSPSRYPRVMERFSSEYSRLGVRRLSVGDLGRYLYSDFRVDPGKLVDRQRAREIVAGELSKLRREGIELMLEGANAYTLPHAAHVFNAPVTSRGQAIIDQPVPFYAIVTSGLVMRSAPPANLHYLTEEAYLLKLLETGMLPSFTVGYAPSSAVKHTDYHHLYRTAFGDVKAQILSIYHEARDVLGRLWYQPIADHTCYTAEVCRSLFEDGTSVIVNYGREPFEGEGLVVPAMGYVVITDGKEGAEHGR